MTEKKTSKSDKAIALQYDDKDALPHVTAVGYNYLAERIIALAKANQVPVYQDDTLANLLSTVAVGQAVPEEGLALVAEVVSFLCYIDQRIS